MSSSMFCRTSMSESTRTTRSYSISSKARSFVHTLAKRLKTIASCVSVSPYLAHVDIQPAHTAYDASHLRNHGTCRGVHLFGHHHDKGVSCAMLRKATSENSEPRQHAGARYKRRPARIAMGYSAIRLPIGRILCRGCPSGHDRAAHARARLACDLAEFGPFCHLGPSASPSKRREVNPPDFSIHRRFAETLSH